MQENNRRRLLNTDMCDILKAMNANITKRSNEIKKHVCIMYALGMKKDDISCRCFRYLGDDTVECDKCIQDWMNE